MTKRMVDGMAESIEQEDVSVADYARYCCFVAGIVGIGLSRVRTSQTLPQTYNSPAISSFIMCALVLQPFSATFLLRIALTVALV